jgi:hypothetical protein
MNVSYQSFTKLCSWNCLEGVRNILADVDSHFLSFIYTNKILFPQNILFSTVFLYHKERCLLTSLENSKTVSRCPPPTNNPKIIVGNSFLGLLVSELQLHDLLRLIHRLVKVVQLVVRDGH